jgi:hypothetical protein
MWAMTTIIVTERSKKSFVGEEVEGKILKKPGA